MMAGLQHVQCDWKAKHCLRSEMWDLEDLLHCQYPSSCFNLVGFNGSEQRQVGAEKCGAIDHVLQGQSGWKHAAHRLGVS